MLIYGNGSRNREFPQNSGLSDSVFSIPVAEDGCVYVTSEVLNDPNVKMSSRNFKFKVATQNGTITTLL